MRSLRDGGGKKWAKDKALGHFNIWRSSREEGASREAEKIHEVRLVDIQERGVP